MVGDSGVCTFIIKLPKLQDIVIDPCNDCVLSLTLRGTLFIVIGVYLAFIKRIFLQLCGWKSGEQKLVNLL